MVPRSKGVTGNKTRKGQLQQQPKTKELGKDKNTDSVDDIKTVFQKAMDDGKKLPKGLSCASPPKVSKKKNAQSSPAPPRSFHSPDRSPGNGRDNRPSSPQQSPSRRNDVPRGGEKKIDYPSSPMTATNHLRTLTPWMTGGNLLRAPAKPTLTLPKNWTTRSGRFRPSEAGWGFDALSTFGLITAAGLSVVSGKVGSFANGRPLSSRNCQGEDSISAPLDDPKQREQFYADLEEKGIKPVIVVDSEWETRSIVSNVSMSDASYILDLAQQKQYRHQGRQEEALEEAFILYKAALVEGAVDNEEMFFMFLEETRKELDEKYYEKDRKLDEMLDAALQAELERREAEKQNKKNQVYSDKNAEGTTQVPHLIADEEYYAEVTSQEGELEENLNDDPENQSERNNKQEIQMKETESLKDVVVETSKEATITKRGVGFFSCCGKDVEDSVVIGKSSSGAMASNAFNFRDPSFFQRLRKKQEEERKKEVELTDEDKWWQKNPVTINVPEAGEDMPSRSCTSKSNESSESENCFGSANKTSSTRTKDSGKHGHHSRKKSRSPSRLSLCTSDTPESDPREEAQLQSPDCFVSDLALSSSETTQVERTLSDEGLPTSGISPAKSVKRGISLAPSSTPKQKPSPRKSRSAIELETKIKKDRTKISQSDEKNKKKRKSPISPKQMSKTKSKEKLLDSEKDAKRKQRSRSKKGFDDGTRCKESSDTDFVTTNTKKAKSSGNLKIGSDEHGKVKKKKTTK